MTRYSRRTLLKASAALCRRFRDRISGDQRPDRQDQDRPSDAADRLSRRARRLCPARHANGRGGNQPGRRRHGTPARRHVGRFGQSRHRRDQGAAHARAGRRHGADGRNQFGLGADHHAGGRAQQEAVHADRRALRRAARQELQQIHLPRRHPEHGDGQRRRQGAAARQHGEGQEVLHADRRLYLRPRSAGRGQALLRRQSGQPDRRRTDRHRRHRLQSLSAEDPSGQARRGLLQPRRQSGHQPDQAICRIRPALSDRRLQPQHRRRLGGGRRQPHRHLADGLVSHPRRSGLEDLCRELHQEERQAAGEPCLDRIHLVQDHGAGHERDQVDRHRQADRLFREGNPVRHPEGAQGLFPLLGSSAGAGSLSVHGEAEGPGQGQVGPPRRSARPFPRRTSRWKSSIRPKSRTPARCNRRVGRPARRRSGRAG